MSIVIKNGLVATSEGLRAVDLLAQGGVIRALGAGLEGDQTLDAGGMLVLPGFIDPHTHMDLDTGATRTADDFITGTRAALMGGTTTIVDFATQDKGGSLGAALAHWHGLARGSYCDYAFHMAITDWNEEVCQELGAMAQEGVTSYKVYMAYDNLRLKDGEIYAVLKAVQGQGGIVGAHCENGDIINCLVRSLKEKGVGGPAAHALCHPNYAESEAVYRLLAIARAAACPVNIVHLSTKEGLRFALEARERGQRVFIETCPQYLYLDGELYKQPGFEGAKYVMSPPLRGIEDRDALWQALREGRLDTVGTDHCSFNMAQKELGREDFSKIPNGAGGVGYRGQLMYTAVTQGKLSIEAMCRLLAQNPAKLYGMWPYRGQLAVGSRADAVVWDGQRSTVLRAADGPHNCDITPFEGMAVRGAARHVLLGGQLAVKDGKVTEPMGQYVARGPCVWPR